MHLSCHISQICQSVSLRAVQQSPSQSRFSKPTVTPVCQCDSAAWQSSNHS